jgi:hypothetical protein
MTKREALEAVGLKLENRGHSMTITTRGGRKVIFGAYDWNLLDTADILERVIWQVASDAVEVARVCSDDSRWENADSQGGG